MAEEIIALLSNKDTMSLGIEDISKKLHIKDKGLLKNVLSKMVSQGILDYSIKKNKYLLFENSNLSKGRIRYDKKGNGIVKLIDKDILILKHNLKGASYNDLVAIDYDSRSDTGVVARIIERDNSNYVGTVIMKNNKLYVSDVRLGLIEVNNPDIVEGSKVLIHHFNGNNEIVSVLGHINDPGIDIKSVVYDYGFSDTFNDSVMEELDNIPNIITDNEIEEELSRGRVDYRDKTIFTIDGSDTKDFDDAVSIKELDNGNIELGVYIADVDYYISSNTSLYDEAIKRGTSVYPPGSVVPMFPHKISNGICSLNPNASRFVMAYTTTFDNLGNVIDFRVEEGIINSNKRMTYEDVNQILENNNILDSYKPYLKDLYLMHKLSLLINKNLVNHGFLSFDTDEAKVILDDNYKTINIEKRNMGSAEKLIEHFMLITNIELTKYVYYLGLPWIYRNHGEPNQDRLSGVFDVLRLNKYIRGVEAKRKYTTADISKALKEINGKDYSTVLSRMLITCQDKAKYGDKNEGHSAIGVDFYSHNTSPIRRGPDLINQKILKNFLHNGQLDTYEKYSDLEDLAEHFSKQERRAESCERDACNMKKLEYMSHYIGKSVRGIISYVTEYGFFIMLDNTVEGYIRVDELPQDRYKFDFKKLSLGGRKHAYKVGDIIDVKIKRVNVDTKTIEFTTKDYNYEEEIDNKKVKKRIKNKNRND